GTGGTDGSTEGSTDSSGRGESIDKAVQWFWAHTERRVRRRSSMRLEPLHRQVLLLWGTTYAPFSESSNGPCEMWVKVMCRTCAACFGSLPHARAVIHAWKEEYNIQRPHSTLQHQTPAAFGQSLAT